MQKTSPVEDLCGTVFRKEGKEEYEKEGPWKLTVAWRGPGGKPPYLMHVIITWV